MDLRLKQAFLNGARKALVDHGVLPEEEKSTLRKALPWLAAAGAGAGAYKFLRTPSFSKNPALRKIQELASSKGFHRAIDVTHDAGANAFQAVANEEGKLSPWNKLKLFMNEGTTDAIPYISTDKGVKLVGAPRGRRVKGVVARRGVERDLRQHIRGGLDLEGPLNEQRLLHRLARGGKRQEAALLAQYAPDAIPQTYTDLNSHFVDLPTNRSDAVRELQNRIKTHYGSQVMLKPDQGLASGGRFPRTSQDWGEQLTAYDRHFADPNNKATIDALHEEGGNALSKHLRDNGLYEGHVLHHALQDPKSVIAQQMIQNPLGEYRVHTTGGTAPSQLTFSRHNPGIKGKLKGIPNSLRQHNEMRQFVESTLAKLPAKYRTGNYGFDVMPYRKLDGSVGFKVLEMNPAELGTAAEAGGGSGFIASDKPLVGNLVYRAATGRHTPFVGGLGGLGAASLTGLGVNAALNANDD